VSALFLTIVMDMIVFGECCVLRKIRQFNLQFLVYVFSLFVVAFILLRSSEDAIQAKAKGEFIAKTCVVGV